MAGRRRGRRRPRGAGESGRNFLASVPPEGPRASPGPGRRGNSDRVGREWGEGTHQADPGEGGNAIARFGGARGTLTFFQTFPGFISETFGARRRPSFRLPGGAKWGGRGAIAAPRGCGGGRVGGERGAEKTRLQVFAVSSPGNRPCCPPPATPARLAFQPQSPSPGAGRNNPASPRGSSYLGIGGAVLIRL